MALPWDTGLTWRTTLSATDDTFIALEPSFVTDRVLRAPSGGEETDLIEHYIKAATTLGERWRGEHIAPKTLTMILSGFPTGAIELQDNPVREVTGIAYVDADGVTQDFDNVSPHTWIFVASGRYNRATIEPAYGDVWPGTRTQPNAVTVTFTVGYATADELPSDIRQALAVTVGELYKNPDLSNADGQGANLLGVSHFWPRRW